MNLRAVLIVLIEQAGGNIDITNANLYDAMLRSEAGGDGFRVEETATGLRLSTGSGSGDERE